LSANSHSKRILVVALDEILRQTRVLLLKSQGYTVESVSTADEAAGLLKTSVFDLVLIGRDNGLFEERIRQSYPSLLILKVQSPCEGVSVYSSTTAEQSRTVDNLPEHVIDALKQMLDC
jgi:CheY-like chemotaxis protein